MRIGMSEILVILLAALILFGPSRLPEMGKALGKAIREFRNATSDLGKELEQVREEINREAPPATAKQSAKPASETSGAAETDPDLAAGDSDAKGGEEDAPTGQPTDDVPQPKPQSSPV